MSYFFMPNDIRDRLDKQYLPVIELKSAEDVRQFLENQDLEDLKLYWNTFQETLKKNHADRAYLIEEEFKRREPTDWVSKAIKWLREKPIPAAFILLILGVGFAANFKEQLCDLTDWCKPPPPIPDCNDLTELECELAKNILKTIEGIK
ncbi:hypothetical protein [Parasedimentitalea huanghaiensis]|nr:hypothetical protein [Zongyanglinia huanghaiensis]